MLKIRTSAVALAASALVCLGAATPASAAAIEDSWGPITRLETTPDLQCAADVSIRWPEPTALNLGTACATFAAIGDNVIAPANGPRGRLLPNATSGIGNYRDPRTITTVVTGGGLELTQTDKYGLGTSSFKTSIQVRNTSTAALAPIIYRGIDCSGPNDWSFPDDATGDGSVVCRSPDGEVTGPGGMGLTRGVHIMQLIPLTLDSHYENSSIRQVWGHICAGSELHDMTADPNLPLDQAMALSWKLDLQPGASKTIGFQTHFSLTDTRALPTTIDVSPAVDGTSTVTLSFGTPANPGPLPFGIGVMLPEGTSYVDGSSTTVEADVFDYAVEFLPPADSTASSFSFEIEAGEAGVDGLIRVLGSWTDRADIFEASAHVSVESQSQPPPPTPTITATPSPAPTATATPAPSATRVPIATATTASPKWTSVAPNSSSPASTATTDGLATAGLDINLAPLGSGASVVVMLGTVFTVLVLRRRSKTDVR